MGRKAIKQILEDLMGGKIGKFASFPCLEDTELSAREKADLTYDEVFAMNLINKSLNGDMKASTEIMDRRYGKAQQHIIQETTNVTYHTFLDSLVEQQAKPDALPQVTIDVTPVDGGSTEVDIMKDLGL